MNEPLRKVRVKPGIQTDRQNSSQVTEIISLDDIPEFDSPEAEVAFWKTHHMSKELLDQVPNALEPEE